MTRIELLDKIKQGVFVFYHKFGVTPDLLFLRPPHYYLALDLYCPIGNIPDSIMGMKIYKSSMIDIDCAVLCMEHDIKIDMTSHIECLFIDDFIETSELKIKTPFRLMVIDLK